MRSTAVLPRRTSGTDTPHLAAVPAPPPSEAERRRADEREAFGRLKATGDPALRAQIIEDHLWVARHAVRRFAGRGEERDDLFQVASFALVNAVDRFDPQQGNRFATFAMPTILGELRRHFRDKTWAMRVPRRLKDLHVNVRTVGDELRSRLGRSPSVEELADALDTTPEEVLEALEAGASYKAHSLDQPITSSDDGGDGTERSLGFEDADLESSEQRLAVRDALSDLPERERTVVCLYYFGELTQLEIAERVGVSQVHVSRILRSSLDRLRDALGDEAALPPIRSA
jgi:RNA polymerase sigma-B factor